MSTMVCIIVSGVSHSVPGAQECSSDFVIESVGSCHTSMPCAAARATAAVAEASATMASVASGRCGPWCSIAPVGSTMIDFSVRASAAAGPLSSARRRLTR